MKKRKSLIADADIREVCSAATAEAERLRWLGYPEMQTRAKRIDASVAALVAACSAEEERV